MTSLARAIDLLRQGNTRAAELECERRIAADGDDAEAHSLLAEIRMASGCAASALALLERLTQLSSRDAAAHRRLGAALLDLDRAEAAVETLREAVRLQPDNVRGHNNLGQALMRLGRIDDALGSFAEALRLDDRYAIGHNNLGLALTANAEFGRAEQSFRRAIALDPMLAVAEINLASVFEQCGRLPEAASCYERALARSPQFAEAWAGRGSVLLALERAADALQCADAALALKHTFAPAHNVRAGALRRLGRHSQALYSLEQALALDPEYGEAWCNRAMILHETGEFEASIASYRKALELDPDNIQARSRLLARLIPSVPLSEEELSTARSEFEAQMLQFESWLEGKPLHASQALMLAQQQFFYLSYEEIDNRPLLERYRGASAARLARLELFSTPRPPPTPNPAERASPRLKIGFVSAHVHDHSVFNAILRGWLEHLDHDRFELALFSVGAKQDQAARAAAAWVDQAEIGPRPLMAWAESIRDRDFDALIFPEVGMNETTLALAGLKLAKRQFAAWGHPETSGLPTIEGYLSAEAFEPPDAQAHYTERLLPLPNLGVHCRPYEVPSAPLDLEKLGVAADRPLLLCPGVPFKYRPQDDWILIEIARRLGRCTLVFFQYEVAGLSEKLRARIGSAFRDAGLDPSQFLAWVPWQPRAAFFELLRHADVYLDTIGFSGFNTMMQAVECHLPCVTYEGRFMRGRLGSGILRRLGISELVAVSKRHYIELAVELASSAPRRRQIRETIRRAEPIAYADMSAISALARILSNE